MQIRCPSCEKRLFDLEQQENARFALFIVCRCRQTLRIEMPNPNRGKSPLIVRAA
jgi:hypothetical protein